MDGRKVAVWMVLIIALASSSTWAVAQSGGEWTIGRWVVVGGGGTSSGGGFLVRGSLGQPEAGEALSGGEFTLHGGFWPGESGLAPTPTPTQLRLPYVLKEGES